jgi:hypothetical protein
MDLEKKRACCLTGEGAARVRVKDQGLMLTAWEVFSSILVLL